MPFSTLRLTDTHRARLTRRGFLLLTVPAAVWTVGSNARAGTEVEGFHQLEIELEGDQRRYHRALVVVPRHLDPDARHPGVILLPGYGQAMRRHNSIHAWRDDYGLFGSYERLQHPPVRKVLSQRRFLTTERQEELSNVLGERPFQGLILICPMCPIPYYSKRSVPVFEEYADWIEHVLLPQVRAEAPLSMDCAELGLAGVSMGGHVALELFARRSQLFAAFTGIQMAIDTTRASTYARHLALAFEQAGPRRMQLLTSSLDLYGPAHGALQRALARRNIDAELSAPPGPHNASWMREIGSLEALLWQDRALRSV